MKEIARNLQAVEERIERAAARSGRPPNAITLVAVSKTRSAEEIEAAIAAGVTHLGENRVQEAEAKRRFVQSAAAWHLVGRLQSNKAGRAVELFDVVQSVDSVRLAATLQRRALQSGRSLDVLLQVNSSGAAGQGGITPEATLALAGQVAGMSRLRVLGLMTIAEFTSDEARLRSCFARMRSLSEDLDKAAAIEGVDTSVLSMGMSGDFEIAIEEGASMVRVGTAIFGPRTAQ